MNGFSAVGEDIGAPQPGKIIRRDARAASLIVELSMSKN
jgi:hypothetical protein